MDGVRGGVLGYICREVLLLGVDGFVRLVSLASLYGGPRDAHNREAHILASTYHY